MAEGLAKKMLGDKAKVESAGLMPMFECAAPDAVAVLNELFDVDISEHRPKGITELSLDDYDRIIVLDAYVYNTLSKLMKDHSDKLVLWDTDQGNCFLSERQVWQTYSQAAMILTLYYDTETFEQIFPWHHAAGDFVVRAQENSLDVRLVTARQYAPMMEPPEKVSIHEGLLFFLLNLSVRMRLDRLDGVGEVAWADDECMDATLEGFLGGLRIKEREGMLGGMLVDPFIQHCACLDQEDLSDRFHALVNACDQAAPDIPVIRTHLDSHIAKFHKAVQGLKHS